MCCLGDDVGKCVGTWGILQDGERAGSVEE